MSNNNPIPTRDRVEFFAYMQGFDLEGLSEDAAQWALTDAAEEFMIKKKYVRGDPHTAMLQYIRSKS